MVYQYHSFSDTAKYYLKYALNDTTLINGGWSFYKRGISFFSDSTLNLTDTTIDGILYKRIVRKQLVKPDNQNLINTTIGYLRCDKKGFLIHLDKTFDENHFCPLTMYEYHLTGKPTIFAKLEFVSERLRRNEANIFEAWQQNVNGDSIIFQKF